jgi:hypothetical protein
MEVEGRIEINVNDLDDIGVWVLRVTETMILTGFFLEAGNEVFLFGKTRQQGFEGELSLEAGVANFEYFSHPSLAEKLQDGVFPRNYSFPRNDHAGRSGINTGETILLFTKE